MHTESKGLPMFAVCSFAALAVVVASPGSFAHGDEAHGVPSENPADIVSASTEPRAVAEAFGRALATGDSGTVQLLMLPDVLIYESGEAETSAAEYSGHHMPADMAFLANLKYERVSQASGGDGAYAWVATRSRLSGRFKDKDVDLDSTETLVLTKMNTGWRIAHIHWSSAPHRNPNP